MISSFRILLLSLAASAFHFNIRNCTDSIFADAEDLRLRQATSSGLLLMSGRIELPERLNAYDFPIHFVDGRHPQDYQLLDTPITPECLVETVLKTRFILRVSWRVGNKITAYVPMSFILETRLPSDFYFSDSAYKVLAENGRIKYNAGDLYETCSVNEGQENSVVLMAALPSPEGLENVNFMGAHALMKFGLNLGEPQGGFSFRNNISWF